MLGRRRDTSPDAKRDAPGGEGCASIKTSTPGCPPPLVAVVMVLQRIETCLDREAVERFSFDAR